jgi:hypothetical protein
LQRGSPTKNSDECASSKRNTQPAEANHHPKKVLQRFKNVSRFIILMVKRN